MVRDESDIVGENVEDIWWGRLDSKVRGVAIVQDAYLDVSFASSRAPKSSHRLIPHCDAAHRTPCTRKPDPSFQMPVSSIP